MYEPDARDVLPGAGNMARDRSFGNSDLGQWWWWGDKNREGGWRMGGDGREMSWRVECVGEGGVT